MYLQTAFDLSLVLDNEKFIKLLNKASLSGNLQPHPDDDTYVDDSLTPIIIMFRDSRYKKKVRLTINPAWLLDNDEPAPNKVVRKLEKRIDTYFNSKYHLDDFKLSGMVLTSDIDVKNREKVSDYLQVLKRVGRVKGFSPTRNNWLDDDIAFCLDGNSNGIEFMIYDLEGLLRNRLKETDHGRKQLKSITDKSEGILRSEVHLTEAKAIRGYTVKTDTADQIADLLEKSQGIFLDIFQRVMPFGDFYKKDKTIEIIRNEVTDNTLKRRMLRLIDLIHSKKSLLLAQKTLNYRRIDEVMEAFADIEVSPVTISKRHDVKKLDNLYKYM